MDNEGEEEEEEDYNLEDNNEDGYEEDFGNKEDKEEDAGWVRKLNQPLDEEPVGLCTDTIFVTTNKVHFHSWRDPEK